MAKTAASNKGGGKPSREIARQEKRGTSVSTELLREQDAGKGVSTDMADNIVPLLKILQSLSPQVLKQKAEHIKGAEAGMIWARGTKDVWSGDEGVRVVPCYYERIWLEWAPKRGDGLKGRHRHGTDETPCELGAELKPDDNGKDRWTMPNGNVLQDCREHVVLLLDKYDSPTPLVLPMTGSNIGTSRSWHTMMNRKRTKKGNKAASFGYVYELTSIAASNDEGDWFKSVVDDISEETTDDVYMLARQINADFAGGVLVSDVEEPHGENESSGDI